VIVEQPSKHVNHAGAFRSEGSLCQS
jgi:hypothetical protein